MLESTVGTGLHLDLVVDSPSGRVAKPLRRLGKYELFAKIAAGGMAEVYLARLRGPMNFQKVVVVKVIHPQLAAQEEFLRMLFDEARLSALIRHPRVVDIYELGRAEGVYFIAMEYLDGEPLTAVMTAGLRGSQLDPLNTARLIADAADGLHAAHELKTASGTPVGLVHRDVSPGNVMVLHDGTAKIVDFGVAKARGRLTISGARQFKGKLGYVAPEQLTGQPVDRRADIYGLGVVMWEALVLQRYRSEADKVEPKTLAEQVPRSPSAIRPDIPDQLSEICVKALAPRPEDRFQTAGEMRDAIEQLLHGIGHYHAQAHVRRYMERVFDKQHEARQRSIRKLAAISASGEHEIPLVALPEEDDEVELVAAPTEGTPSTQLARGTPIVDPDTATSAATAPRSRGGGLILALLVVLAGTGGAVAWKYFGPGQADQTARAPAARGDIQGARTAARAGDKKPVEPPTEPVTAAATGGDATADAGAAEGASAPTGDDGDPKRRDRDHADRDRTPKETRTPAQLYDEGAALFVQGKLDAARDKFKQALSINSRHAPSHRGLGLVYASEGNKRKSIKEFERYLQLRPNASDAEAIRKRIASLQ